jgi:hypothetical protein
MGDIIKEVFGKFDALLRSTFPGLFGVAALCLMDPSLFDNLRTAFGDGKTLWIAGTVGAAIGLVLYSLHLNLLEDLMLHVAYIVVCKRSPDTIPPRWLGRPFSEVNQDLARERWCRCSDNIPETDWKAAAIQKHVNRVFGWQIFTYCTSWALLLVAAIAVVCLNQAMWKVALLFASWAVLFSCAFVSDIRTTRHEAWLSKTFPQI